MSQSLVIKKIGFVSTRISGTDGVSLEIGKWSRILERMGCEGFYVCGRSDRPAERSFVIEEADFLHPEIVEIDKKSFGRQLRTRKAICSPVAQCPARIRVLRVACWR